MSIRTPAWVRDAVFYQIFPDRFASSSRVRKPGTLEAWDAPPTPYGFKGGDLLGIAEHLDHLDDLGVTALYLTPVFASASNHRYHTYDYYAVDPLLGGTEALRELLDACHARGMRLFLDGVFNHTGRGFWPFHHVMETGAASPYRRWFHFDQAALEAGVTPRAYAPPADPTVAADTGSLARFGYRAWWDLPALPKLNTDEPDVREFLFSVAEHWIRFGADGWRLDVPGEIDDPDFWREFRRRVKAVNEDAYIVGEIWREAPDWLAGDRFDALMDYPLTEAIIGFASGAHLDLAVTARQHEYREFLKPLDGAGFAAALDRIIGLYDPAVTAVQLNLLGSHDTPRLRTVAGGDTASVRLATLIQMTLPGAPCVYYGDEVGLEGGPDPDCRRAFPWDTAKQDTELRAFVRAAIRLRRDHGALRQGAFRTLHAEGQALAYERSDEESRFIVAVNAGDGVCPMDVPVDAPDGTRFERQRLPGTVRGDSATSSAIVDRPAPEAVVVAGGTLRVVVGGREGLVLMSRSTG